MAEAPYEFSKPDIPAQSKNETIPRNTTDNETTPSNNTDDNSTIPDI